MTRVQHVSEHIVSTHARDVAADKVHPDDDLIAIGVLDSLSLVRLVSWVGAEYNIDVNNTDIHPDDFRTVHRICAFLEHHRPETDA